MGFSTKANTEAALGNSETGATGSSSTPEQWKEWDEYYFGLIKGEAKQSVRKDGSEVEGKTYKKTTSVGILKAIFDLGTQPQQDSSYDSKCALPEEGEDYSAEEREHMKKFPTNDFVWEDGKRKQTKPERPAQEYVFMYDFPKIMVDWTKHPLEDMQRLGVKPLRVSYNGSFTKGGVTYLGKNLRLTPHWQTKKLSPNNPIMKIASSSRLLKEFEDSSYDLGTLVESACKWEVFLEKRVVDNKTYFQPVIKNHSEITEVDAGDVVVTIEQQIPQCDTEFVGVLMNGGDYPDNVLEVISHRKELMSVLPRSTTFYPNKVKAPDFTLGVSWEESDLCKALTAYLEKNGKDAPKASNTSSPESEVNTQPKKEVVSKASTQAPVTKESVAEKAEEFEGDGYDFDTDVPF